MAKIYANEYINVLHSDLTTVYDNVAPGGGSIAKNVSDIAALASDAVAVRSDLFNCIQDSIIAYSAMDTANVSDLVVGLGEILTAFSDALY